jgi:hypothetical protein
MRHRRIAVVATAVVLLAQTLGAAAAVQAAPASLRLTEATPLTMVVLDSSTGEYIGQGRAYTFLGPEIISVSGSANGISLEVSGGGLSHRIELGTIGPLAVGAYENATWNGDPHLSVSLGSTGSSGIGRFDVLEAPVVAGGALTTFAADFSLDNQLDGKLLYGQIRINSSVPIKAVDIDAPGNDELDFGAGTVMQAATPTPVTVTNVGSLPITLSGLTLSGTQPGSFPTTWTCAATLDPGASCTISVGFRPMTSGFNDGHVTFATDALHWGRWFRAFGTATFADAPNLTPETALTIGSLPFGHGGNLNPDLSSGGWIACPGDYGSLWYKYQTATRKRVELDPTGSTASVAVMVMSGTSSAPPFACGQNAPVTFTAEPNIQYWIRVQHKYDFGGGTGIVLQARDGAADSLVDVSGVGVSLTTFYPYRDSYKDTVSVKGVRGEKASVAIGIYNSTTKAKVRSLSVASGTGAWSVAWNGRTSSGSTVPAGKYRVTQTVTDVWGNKLTFTSYTTISWKRLYTYSWSKTLDAASYASYGKARTGSISKSASSYTGGVRISTGTDGGTAALGYSFTLPSATVYKTLTFQVLGRGNTMAGGFGETGIQNWTLCTTWSDSCVDTWGVTPTTYAWAGVKVSGTHRVSGSRIVRGYVEVWTWPGGGLAKWLDLRDVRLVVSYGVLK